MRDVKKTIEPREENPEWTAADFAAAKPASEIHPSIVVDVLMKNKGGRPRGSDKEQISLRIDQDILKRFRADGAGWQTRINHILRHSMEGSAPSIGLAALAQGPGARREIFVA